VKVPPMPGAPGATSPLIEPTPVGPSKPGPAWQMYAISGAQLADDSLLPLTMSFSRCSFA